MLLPISFLVLLAAAAPLTAARPVAVQSQPQSNGGVAIGPDTRPTPVNQTLWRASKPLPGFPRQFFNQTTLPTGPPTPGPQNPLATQPGPNVTATQPFTSPSESLAFPAVPRNFSASADGGQSASDDGVNSLAVCPNNPAFQRSPITRFASICRVYLNLPDNFFGRCTGTFIDPTHVLLAGHCIASNGKFDIVIRDGRWGTVCCAVGASDEPSSCAGDAQFDIINAVVTEGWLNGNAGNDGALLKVAAQSCTAPGFGVPVRWGSIISNPCANRPFEWDGFPGTSTPQGCDAAWNGGFFFSISSQTPNPCPAPNAGTQIQLIGSSCPGMSGGPLWNRVDDNLIGILVSSSVTCSSNGLALVQFTQIALSPGVDGVFVESLRNLIP